MQKATFCPISTSSKLSICYNRQISFLFLVFCLVSNTMHHQQSTLKTNNLTHAVNESRRTTKLDGVSYYFFSNAFKTDSLHILVGNKIKGWLSKKIWKDASKGDVKAINKKLTKGESPHVETDGKDILCFYLNFVCSIT